MDVKGVAVKSLPEFIKKKFDVLSLQKWIEALPEASKKIHSSTILASSWYPIDDALIVPTEKLCELFYNGDVQGAEDQGRYSAESALGGVYKIFVKLGTPDFIISRASSILPTYYKPSAMKVVEKRKNGVTVSITAFETPHKVIEARIRGWMARALELSGARDLRIETPVSMTKGGNSTDFVINWE